MLLTGVRDKIINPSAAAVAAKMTAAALGNNKLAAAAPAAAAGLELTFRGCRRHGAVAAHRLLANLQFNSEAVHLRPLRALAAVVGALCMAQLAPKASACVPSSWCCRRRRRSCRCRNSHDARKSIAHNNNNNNNNINNLSPALTSHQSHLSLGNQLLCDLYYISKCRTCRRPEASALSKSNASSRDLS